MSDVMPDPNLYDILADGNVYSKRTQRPMKVKASKNGLPQVFYYRKGRGKTQLLNKVIWTHFHGEIPFLHEMHYVDGDPWNCSLENLYLKDLSDEFTPLKRWPDFAISRDAVLLNTQTMHRIKPILPPSRNRLEFSFRSKGMTRSMSAGLAVWETFMGERVDAQLLGYKDGDFWNCSLENLYVRDTREAYSRKVVEEDGQEFMPLDYYINMVDGVRGAKESGIPQHCHVVL
ncbi:hypothetical protein [Siphovirus Jomon_CT89]|nr:hypothetical protein [Siphovirus Jomon_CT89]